ncbi:hypothetical protein B0A55_09382 [Friedmanniomyces simplex]|uniref:Uncharacterized protein n=1 Tax=Friedmanniomyces simplex TaxID=329884 RepID=A0A4V5NE11_9PEZI|nr:hypothetical protein B0A55_09382 [Friedmanniomyces simplex]
MVDIPNQQPSMTQRPQKVVANNSVSVPTARNGLASHGNPLFSLSAQADMHHQFPEPE